MRRLSLSLIVVVSAVAALMAQDTPQDPPQTSSATFSSGVQLVEVYASVTGADGNPVTGLRQGDFEVYEDGQPQPVTAFAAGEFPLAVALGIDRSWSMNGEPLRLARNATQSFLRALKPADRSMLLSISSEAEVIAPLSTDRAAQVTVVDTIDPWGTTSLHDAIVAALDRLAPEPGRQALVVFSDGADRYSHATAAQVVERARRGNALIYPIAFGKTRAPLLAELATVTGGRSFLLKDAKALDATLISIARELRNQYLLGYAPPPRRTEDADGEWRSIRVELKGNRPGVRVRARDGYTAD